MNEMIEFVDNPQQTMSSLEIAKLTGKPHNDVMKAIRAMEPGWVKVCQGKFSLTSIVVDEMGVEHPTQRLAYPKHKIQRMIASGEITKLRCRVVRLDQQEAVRVKVAMA